MGQCRFSSRGVWTVSGAQDWKLREICAIIVQLPTGSTHTTVFIPETGGAFVLITHIKPQSNEIQHEIQH